MANRVPLAVGEWYHCFTRGVDKRKTFQYARDYERFMQILYLANSTTVLHRSNLKDRSHTEVFSVQRGLPLVYVAAYCIMPNHFHLLLHEITEGGIAKYMQKVGTAYAMYFNIKNNRVGNLFVKPFRSKHVSDDVYFNRVATYIHLNPVELFDPEWKTAAPKNIAMLEKRMHEYTYSSLCDYGKENRAQGAILNPEAKEVLVGEIVPLRECLEEAAEYYQDLGLTS